MNKLSSIVIKFSSVVASLALTIGIVSASTACYWWFNQPKVPAGLDKFVK